MARKTTNTNKVNKTKLAKDLGIGRSSLYYKPKMPEKDLKLKAQIEEVLKEHPAYGHKRIAIHLGINKKRIHRVTKLFKLGPARKTKAPIKKRDLGEEENKKIKNLTKSLEINKPSWIWSSDFTYLPYFNNKFLYLATIIDCYTKEIIGWNLGKRHDTELITKALYEALAKRKKPKIFHSDRGSEYRSEKLSDILNSSKIKFSMSRKSSPWENGIQESFYGRFKLELGHPKCYETLGELIEAISLQIHYYNNSRIHTTIKCPPHTFYQRCVNSKGNSKIIRIGSSEKDAAKSQLNV